jgi:hypothetical protein
VKREVKSKKDKVKVEAALVAAHPREVKRKKAKVGAALVAAHPWKSKS